MNGSLVPWVHALHRHGAMLHTLNPTCAPHWTLEQRAGLSALWQDWDHALVRAASELMPFTAGIGTHAWNDWAVAWGNLQKKTGLDFQKQHEEVAGFHNRLKRTYLSSHLEAAWSAPLAPSSSGPRL